jgi:hypothetical protein
VHHRYLTGQRGQNTLAGWVARCVTGAGHNGHVLNVSIAALQVARAEFPPDPSSVPRVRDLVATVTEHLPHRAREAAGLVASELATNSVVHARTDFEVFAAADDTAVEVVVADRTGWATTEPNELTAGNGLLLVGLLSSEWAAEVEGAGKRVWARLLVDDLPLC